VDRSCCDCSQALHRDRAGAAWDALIEPGHDVGLFCAPGSGSSATVQPLLDAASRMHRAFAFRGRPRGARVCGHRGRCRAGRAVRLGARPQRVYGTCHGKSAGHPAPARGARPVQRRHEPAGTPMLGLGPGAAPEIIEHGANGSSWRMRERWPRSSRSLVGSTQSGAAERPARGSHRIASPRPTRPSTEKCGGAVASPGAISDRSTLVRRE
jgi:hypothetical protein